MNLNLLKVNIEKFLAFPLNYQLWQRIIGANKLHKIYISEFVKPFHGCKILDIGCGPGDILEFLPDYVTYIGLDSSHSYIEHANNKYNKKGCFYVSDINEKTAQDFKDFDIVMANGVLHHLNDDEALKLFQFAYTALKKGGSLITHDGCYVTKQAPIAKLLMDYDRGKYVRTREGYLNLAKQVFDNPEAVIKTNLCHIHYDLILLNCTKKD